jgi:hypothetical protein
MTQIRWYGKGAGVAARCLRALLLLVLAAATTGGAFEQDQRMNSVTIQFGTDSFATANAFGQAFAAATQGQLRSEISSNVADGSFSLVLEMPGLTDLTGTTTPALPLGVIDATPARDTNNPTAYTGASDLDWWYTASPLSVDASGVPLAQVAASITAKVLTASAPGLALNPLGTAHPLRMSMVVMKALVGSASAPLESTNGYPPGHLPSERLDPALVSFTSMTNGQLKGNISAASLAAIPFSLAVSTDQGYTTNNSLLDVLVSGATTFSGFIRLIYPTQPDQVDTNMPVAGAGPPYRFTVNASKVVTGCLDKNGSPVELVTALNAAAYSAYFTFTSDRVIARNVTGDALKPPALSITRSGTSYSVRVTAQDTTTCTIEYKESLADPAWTWLSTFTGTGAPITLTDTNTPGQSRFYRAQAE